MDSLRKYINIVEGREAPLYHAINPGKLRDTLNSNTLKATWTHDIPGMGKQTGISLTRNKNVKYNYVVLVLDQAKLAQKFKMIPVDGEHLFYKSDTVRDRGSSISTLTRRGPNNLQLAEEFLIGDIPNLSNYLLEIHLVEPTHGTTVYHSEDLARIMALLQDYSSKHNNIPIIVEPKIKRQLPVVKSTKLLAIPNKYIVIDITDNDDVKLLLLKNNAALKKFKDALENDEQDELYTATVDDDYMLFDDWDGDELEELADEIYLFPLTAENRKWWEENFHNLTPEEYVDSH
jgi:biopolymer transport protein ExbD